MTDRDKELKEILARKRRRVYEDDRFHYQEYVELTADERDAMVNELQDARSLLIVANMVRDHNAEIEKLEAELIALREVAQTGGDFKSAVARFLGHLGYWAKENDVEIPGDFLIETYLRVSSLAFNVALADWEKVR